MQTECITSLKNPLLKHIRKLQSSRDYREECKEFVADGWKLLNEALKWYPRIRTVIITQEASCPALPQGVRLVEIPESLMESLSSMKTPQGVIFTCELPSESEAQVERGMLVLDRIQDPGNLGTILRTADAFGVKVLLTNGCADPFSEKTIRASMGAVFRTLPQRIDMYKLMQLDIPMAATVLSEKSNDLRELDLTQYLVIIGSEGQGICEELQSAAKRHIIIPMHPRCESLNAAVAAAIVMWQMQ